MLKWLFIIILAIVVEVMTIDLVSLWIIVGGLIGLLLSYLHLNLWIQWIGFIIGTLLTAILVKNFGKGYLRGNIEKTNIDRYIQKNVLLTKKITAYEAGEAMIGGESWKAISYNHEEIEEGQEVTILKIEGNKLVVRK